MSYNPQNPNGQATSANSAPVVLASDQSTIPVSAASLPLPAGAATEATLATRLTESDFDTKTGALTETAPATDTASSGVNGRLQRIAQRLTSLIALVPTSLGQKTKANSFAVTLASDSDALPVTDNGGSLTVDGSVSVSGTVTANIGTSGSLALDATLTGGTQQSKLTDGTNIASVLKNDGTAAAENALKTAGAIQTQTISISSATSSAVIDMAGYAYATITVTAVPTATVAVQTCDTNVSGDFKTGYVQYQISTNTSPQLSTLNQVGQFTYTRQGRYFRINVSSYTSGTLTATVTFYTYPTQQFPATVTVLPNATSAGAVPTQVYLEGLRAQTSLPTAVADAQSVYGASDKYGRAVVLNHGIRDILSSQTTTISASTSETTIVTAASSIFNDIYALIISNTSATAARIDFRDTTGGSILFSLYIPAGDVRGVSFSTPIAQTTVNTNWTAQSSASVTDLRVAAFFVKNK